MLSILINNIYYLKNLYDDKILLLRKNKWIYISIFGGKEAFIFFNGMERRNRNAEWFCMRSSHLLLASSLWSAKKLSDSEFAKSPAKRDREEDNCFVARPIPLLLDLLEFWQFLAIELLSGLAFHICNFARLFQFY